MKNFLQDLREVLNYLKEFVVIFSIILIIFSFITVSIFSEDKTDDPYTSDYEVNANNLTNNPYSSTSTDHDCRDFKNGKEAQLFYLANGGPISDPHGLDKDNDGRACDWGP